MPDRNTRGSRFGGSPNQRAVGVGFDPAVIDWVAGCRARGMRRDRIVRASREDGFPGSKPLSNGSLGVILAVLYDRAVRNDPRPKKKGPTQGGKRRRQLYDQIREDGASRLREMQIDIAEATMKVEHYELPEDVGLNDEEQEDIASLFTDLTNLFRWTESALQATVAQMGDLEKRRTIKKARDRAEHPSCPPAERAAARLAVERLEASYRAKRLEAN
jgi:hypothetical protein